MNTCFILNKDEHVYTLNTNTKTAPVLRTKALMVKIVGKKDMSPKGMLATGGSFRKGNGLCDLMYTGSHCNACRRTMKRLFIKRTNHMSVTPTLVTLKMQCR